MSRIKYNVQKQEITIPEVRGVVYTIDGEPVSGKIKIQENTTVEAVPQEKFHFPKDAQTSWTFEVPTNSN